MPNVTVDSSILWFVWIYMMIFQWGLSKAIQTVAVQRLPLLVSVLFYHGYSSLPRPWCCWVNFLKKKPASRPLSFDHPVPVQGSHSFPSMEKLASHRTILPCRRKKCSSLEVVVLWRSLECHDHRKSRYIMIYQDISRYIKMFEESRSSLSRDSLSSTHPEASAGSGSVEIPITAGSIGTPAASLRDLNVPMFQSQKPQVHV